MKSFYKKNRKLISIVLLLIIVILALWRILDNYKGFSFKGGAKDVNSSILEKVDVAKVEEYSKFEDKIESYFEGKRVLNFSTLYPKDMKIERGVGNQQNWFKAFDTEKSNYVTLYFTYEGGRGFTTDDYIKEILSSSSTKVQDLKFINEDVSDMKYVIDEAQNVEYYLKSVKNEAGDTWLAIIENMKADDSVSTSLAKDIFRSLETN